MAKKRTRRKNTSVIKTEMMIVIVFVLSFLAWGVSKCNFREMLARKPAKTAQVTPDTSNDSTTRQLNQRRETIHVTELYVTVDSFNFRTTPKLDGSVIKKLRFGDKVIYLNQVTDFTQKIFLNQNWEDRPWIKVRTIEGEEGWVYGAGVSFIAGEHVVPFQ